MIERAKPFYGWAVPGGFVDIGEIVEQAAFRETLEEIRPGFRQIKQVRYTLMKKRVLIIPAVGWNRTLKAAEALEKSFAADGRIDDVINFDFRGIFTTIPDNQ